MSNPQNSISINGQVYIIYFGYPCFSDYMQACINEPRYSNLQSGEGISKLLQCAYENFCLIEGVKPSLQYKDFYMWVEQAVNEDNKEEIERLLNIWAECTTTKKSLEKIQALQDEQKKSLIAV